MDGFFLDFDGLKCLENPTGIKNCYIYSSKD